MKKIIYIVLTAVLVAAGFGAGIWVGVNKVAYYVPQPGTVDFSLFWDAYQKLQQNFIDPSKINDQKIMYGAIEGMARSLGDPYTAFFDPEQAKRFEQDLSGTFEGIGVEIGLKKNQLTVISPLEGTPGQKAGLKPGDVILKIDGKDSSDMMTDEAVSLIRGQKGTTVTLTVFRDGWQSPRDFKITREMIKIPSMKWELKNGNVAYIHIYQFDEQLPDDFKQAVFQILSGPAKKIVLDLRDNPGGYLEVSQQIAGWFLPQSQIVAIEDFGKGKEQKQYKSEGSSNLSDYPVVILINQGSASASEILAGALRDDRNVKLIGEKSFGKGSVQEVLDLRGGSLLKITIAKWLTPKGNSISEIGLEPDIKIAISDKDVEKGKDPQLDKALEIINTLK